MSDPEDGSKDGRGRPRQARKAAHAHDEFELDISVDTRAGLPAPSEVLPDLFSETLEESGEEEEATEVLTQPPDKPPPARPPRARGASAEIPVRTALQAEVLPIFMPLRGSTPSQTGVTRPAPAGKATPPPRKTTPLPAKSDRSAGGLPPTPTPFRAVVEDLSSGVFPRPGSARPLDLSLTALPAPQEQPPLPGPEEVSDPALDPLDIRQFEMSVNPTRRKPPAGKRGGGTDFRAEPLRTGQAPMAQPLRVVRTVFTFGTRELLILLLFLLIGAGLWIGWMIYQDYSRQLDLERLEAHRAVLDEARSNAILDGQKAKPNERDIP